MSDHLPGVMKHIRRIRTRPGTLGHIHLQKQPVDDVGPGRGGSVAEVGVEDLTADHSDVLVGLQRLPDIDRHVGRRNHLHLGDAAVDDVQRQVELAHHAQGYGPAARLAVVHLALYQNGLYPALGQGLGGGAAGRPAAHDGDSEIPAGDFRAEFSRPHDESLVG